MSSELHANDASRSSDKKPDAIIHIFVDGEQEKSESTTLTARQILSSFTARDPATYYLVYIHGNDRVSYKDQPDQPIELKNGMRFQTVSLGPTPVSSGLNNDASRSSDKKPDAIIHIFVDGEQEKSESTTLTARQILSSFTARDPATYYLVYIHGNDRVSYKDQPDQPIELKNGMRFQTVSLGPTPVSDGSSQLVGVPFFVEGLRQLGYEPQVLPSRPDHVVFEYLVESGSKEGTTVRLGIVVPHDFPATTPTGPHVSPHVFPINPSGSHPHGAIHEQHAQAFAQDLGGQWQYWSRPCSDWNTRKKTVAGYMSHIWNLWDSQ